MSLRRILVLTSHGIRTNAPWQYRLEALIQEEARNRAKTPGGRSAIVTVLHNNYLYFSLFAFMNPWRRRGETKRFEAKLRSFLKDDEYDEIHLVGHSFGTHIIAHSLRNIGDSLKQRIGTVIFAGSVLRQTFPWDGLVGTHVRRLVNDCGDKDAILVLNALLPLGSGLAGRRGFAGIMGDHFRNRFFSFGHSGYFEAASDRNQDDFMRERWIPLLFDAATIDHVDERSNSFLSGLRGWAVDQCQNMKWLIPTGLLASLCFLLLYWALVVRTNFNFETMRDAAAIIDAVNRQNLDEAEAISLRRERAIAARLTSFPTTFEALFRGDVRTSLYPAQFEAAQLTAKFADRPTRRIEDLQPFKVLFRGKNTIEFRSLKNEEFLAEPGNVRIDRYRLDTLQPDEHPMWAWKGFLASTSALPKPDIHAFSTKSDGSLLIPPTYIATRDRFLPLTGTGLQDSIEKRLSVALDGEEFSIWDTFEHRKIARWNAVLWGEVPIIDAHPCGSNGKATAVEQNGRAYVFESADRVSALPMPAGLKLAYLLGNSTCQAFAGVSDNGQLFIWHSLGSPPTSLEDDRRRVRSFEFSKRDPGLLLVNSVLAGTEDEDRRVGTISISPQGQSYSRIEDLPGAMSAVFSTSGNKIVLVLSGSAEERPQCRIIDAPGSPSAGSSTRAPFPCLGASVFSSAQDLSEQIIFVENEEAYVTTDAGPEGFGYSSALAVRRTETNATEWRTIASRSDVVSLDATSDGSLSATVAGDSTGDGMGADWSVKIWSKYHGQPLYERTLPDAFPDRAWLTPDGSQVVILWRRWNKERSGPQFSVEFVPTAADFGQSSGDATQNWPVWGISMSEGYDDGSRSCKSAPHGDKRGKSEMQSPYPNTQSGCWIEGDGLLSARLGGLDILIRFRKNESTSLWSVRALTGTNEERVQTSDGTKIADNIIDFSSDPAGNRIFVAHVDGAVTRFDFKPDFEVKTIYRSEPLNGSLIRSIAWHAQEERLGIEYATVGENNYDVLDRTIVGLTDDGRLVFTAPAGPEFLEGRGVGGVFGPHDEYWSVSRVEISSREVTVAENETETENLYHWFLQNWVTGKRIPLSCNGDAYEVSSNMLAYEPDFLVSRSRRYLATARLGPSIGAFAADSSADVFDLVAGTCVGHVEHGDEILQFGLNDDGRLLITGAKSEAYLWHVPTQLTVGTIYGPTSISSDRTGLRVVTRIASDHPIETRLPSDVGDFLGIAAITVP